MVRPLRPYVLLTDPEIDSAAGCMWTDFEAAQRFRLETLDHVRLCLGLEDQSPGSASIPLNKIVQNFTVIGESIRDALSTGESVPP